MSINRNVLTLDEFTLQQLRQFPTATGELSRLLRDMALAAKRVNVEVNKAGLVDILGDAGSINVQGEDVKKLDIFANNQFMGVLQHGISCAGIGSEEMDDFVVFDDEISNNSKYVVLFDPLDGSGNIDVNVSIGTIFGVYKRVSPLGKPCTKEDFLQPGKNQVAAGYVVYGSSTMFVYATRRGVNGFTLDPSIGEFTMSHPNITCPPSGKFYSVNHGNFFQYNEGVRKYIDGCQRKTKENGGPYTQRYIGSMVADVHRNLIKGGIFMYPGTIEKPGGKLRLLYEANPFAFILEVAGGVATDGVGRILDIVPTSLHQRTPLFIGSKLMMEELAAIAGVK
ncbi:MAG TPA: class 1 fructose-bisphosphatase [Sediminibacterium sp.]|jgi:fructose-1,6-bisphosphatase I|uniref:class 1 fructose-bisphosphatase n=1 Tax=Sediminibacterium sp. TaxID=1917865 RepID=UPI0008B11BE8|nr:class 1 fructose-bisphosphatase [Sediminibacterium sp.]OHC85081.1 MAG: fructose-bisphosphatase [Sphingobacteriia bacterium RIFOXYC2_FULL_35_18]OYY11442.1 MAG: fructose-bisphosphatase class I [Sphingobacteriia bacterium 35-36-14]OYZ55508.1 MAG: fructose-bisphosphatase class I [Sphingobacteriia bacterium 24-36-13]OZA66036.1 MAG: fructose-bisphosphatase class I [Sphingobacteriia bacterium 39-36-14]HLD52247.1 class 1 fructose-bisphosphatase [Sediminibacterium sp.]